MTAPLVVWATPASNAGPRGFTREVLEMGPVGWARWIAPKLSGKGITHVIIAYPGGHEPDASELRFDMVSRAAGHFDPRVKACGDYALWSEACQIIRDLVQCYCGFYVGTSMYMDQAATLAECDKMVHHWGGVADFICIDTLSGRPMGHTDWMAAYRLEAADIRVWAEPAPIRGRPLLPGPHVVIKSTWETSNGDVGDDNHTPRADFEAHGASIIILDRNGAMTADEVAAARDDRKGVCIPVDRVPFVGIHGGAM